MTLVIISLDCILTSDFSYVHWLKQKQLPEAFYKKSYSQKCRSANRKKLTLEPATLLKTNAGKFIKK